MSAEERDRQQKKGVKIKMPEEVARGAYANTMAVFHTREEFVIDFMNVFLHTGVATARVITSPGHMKRIIGALQENLRRYEERFGSVEEAAPPVSGPMGYA